MRKNRNRTKNNIMKSIKLMFLMTLIGMISFTACSESEQTQERTQKENSTTNKEGEDFVELQDLQKREDVISTVKDYLNGTSCSTCRARCLTSATYGEGQYVVSCDDGTVYWVTNCGGEWHVMQAMETGNAGTGHTPIFWPC